MVTRTIPVTEIVKLVNRLNRFSKVDPTVRQGWNSIAEEVLLGTGNYYGFELLGPKEVPAGHLPGLDNGVKGDQTRRKYRLA